MTEIARDALRALVGKATSTAIANGQPVHELQGVAFYDTERDATVRSLASFDTAIQAVTDIPDFVTHFGTDAAERVVLQFVYEYFTRVDELRYDEAMFDALWLDLQTETRHPEWVTRGVANVRHFRSEDLAIDLGDGISVRGRNSRALASLGFGPPFWELLSRDWAGPGASSFVIVAEHTLAKRPENLVRTESGSVWIKAIRAIGALRLAAAGDVSIGPMWFVRPAHFNVGIGGIQGTYASVPAFGGSEYVWTELIARAYPRLYDELAQLERDGYGKSPGNLSIALRSFMATCDRWPPGPDSKLLDATTALEALLGAYTEIAFKLAFRVAGLVAGSDDERSAIFKLMKDFYDTRSRLVHGGHLKKKHEMRLAKVDELRSLVRRVLRAFVAFATNPPSVYRRSFFETELDAALVNTAEREKLRVALGLDRN